MGVNPAAAEIVASAVAAEKEASLFYTMLAEVVSQADVAKRLKALAGDEADHARQLINLHVALTGRAPRTEAPTTAEGDPNLLDFAGSSQRQLLEHALDKELKAASLYDSQARSATDYQGQRLWRMLAETERGHAKYLRLQLKRLEG